MADNLELNAGTGGATLAADDIAGIHHQRVKIQHGADGSATDVSSASPLPVGDAGGSLTVDGTVAVSGTVTVDGSGVTQPVSHAALTELAAAIDTELQVDVVGALPAGNNNIGDVDVASVPAPLSTTGGGTEAAALRVTIANDSTGVLSVDDNGGSLTVDGSVSLAAAIPAGTNNIGDVDVLTLPALPAGTNNIGDVDVLSMPTGASAAQVQGTAAHDAAAAQNPVPVAGAAQDMDDTAPPNRVSAESDVTRLATDRDGAQFVHPHGPQIWSYHVNGSSALTDTSVHAAPGAGLSLYVTDIVVSLGAASALNVFFEEGASTVLGPYYLEAVNGRGMHIKFQTPKKITANTALTVTSSAAVAHSIDVTGFTAQG